jgi:epoxyqueuosine reductase
MDSAEQIHWKTNIKKWGAKLGFAAIGFTSAAPVSGLAEVLQERAAQGLATPFEGKEIARRIDPKMSWQDCQTVVALAYPLPLSTFPREGEGVIARSAVGEDYHHFMRQQINHLVEIMTLHDWPGITRCQVDTGPLVERAFAYRAGIGWIGKNQNLIIPGHGSFVALALLLLDQELEPDYFTMPNQCGTCQKCVQACPAQILGKELFDAKHCVSYLTQCKEELTPEQGKRLGLKIFGCDTCQEVCPHNQKRIEDELTSPSMLRRGVDLHEIFNLTNSGFRSRFKSTAAGWRGRGVLRRNASLAVLNFQDKRY